jgi:hypothetical protein
MTADKFRTMALELPEAVEGAHMGHADFRIGGKIFASLGPDESWGMVKLSPDQQADHVRAEPAAFEPFNGAWGRSGCTKVHLAEAKRPSVRRALAAAWQNTAPKRRARPKE